MKIRPCKRLKKKGIYQFDNTLVLMKYFKTPINERFHQAIYMPIAKSSNFQEECNKEMKQMVKFYLLENLKKTHLFVCS